MGCLLAVTCFPLSHDVAYVVYVHCPLAASLTYVNSCVQLVLAGLYAFITPTKLEDY